VNRRSFLQGSAGALFATALPQLAFPAANGPGKDDMLPTRFAPTPDDWRAFEVTTRIELNSSAGTRRVWLPLPSVYEDTWMRPMGNIWSGNAATTRPLTATPYKAEMLFAQWDDDEPAPVLEVVSRFAARDRKIDWSARGNHRLSPAQRRLHTQPTRLMPTGGIVRRTARVAAGNATSDLEKAQAIYQWIVENSARNPETRGCGLGDVRTMLETGDLSGKCADINTLFVAMCRSLGIPARDVYGVRVADSRFGYRSLGKSGDISKAQHCRAEVFLDRYGWVPVDPADVRKVVLEEQPDLTLSHPLVKQVREQLFGAWESNWMAYNFAHDLDLPMSEGPVIPFLMYPQGETTEGRLDSLEPADFRYRLTSVEIPFES